MSPLARTLARWVLSFADPRKLLHWLYLPRYIRDWRQYQSLAKDRLKFSDSYPCLADWVASTPFDPHYFYQGAWLSRRIADAAPELHVDVGSSVLTIGVLSAQVPTVFVDYRPLNARLPNLMSVGGSIVSLPFASRSVRSVSCMHVLEHIGLGRYGDPIDPEGALMAAGELSRVLAQDGRLYLTTPVGRNRVCFNAHRVFSPAGIVELFHDLTLRSFSWVDDQGRLHMDAQPEDAVDSEYACGFYEFERRHD